MTARPSAESTPAAPPLPHATCVAVAAVGVLLRGPSGAGKSDLALRLIDGGAELVGDDYCAFRVEAGRLIAAPHPRLAGLLEVRGLGLVRLPYRPAAVVGLVIDLVPAQAVERLPEPLSATVLGCALPLLRLDPFTASAAAKVRLAVRGLGGDSIQPGPWPPGVPAEARDQDGGGCG